MLTHDTGLFPCGDTLNTTQRFCSPRFPLIRRIQQALNRVDTTSSNAPSGNVHGPWGAGGKRGVDRLHCEDDTPPNCKTVPGHHGTRLGGNHQQRTRSRNVLSPIHPPAMTEMSSALALAAGKLSDSTTWSNEALKLARRSATG